MRGPIVGLCNEDVLDITAALSPDQDGRRRFQLRTRADDVINPLAKDVLLKLQALHGLAAELTPMQLVVFATERLNVESDYGGPALPAERARSREP